MVDIGLGPTDGSSMLTDEVRDWPPRRVQTDVYHRPFALNYLPFAITSFIQISAKRLTNSSNLNNLVSRLIIVLFLHFIVSKRLKDNA